MSKRINAGDPRTTSTPSKGIVYAIKALRAGNANEGQQTLALDWILNECCGVRDLSYRDSERATCFAEGKRFVGLQIAQLMLMPGNEINQLKD